MAIWADATFVWNPGDAATASSDEVSGNSAAGLTEGTFVSSPRDGRTYSGAEGSRFDALVAAANPQTTGMTLMVAARSPTGSEQVYPLITPDKDDNGQYALIDYDADNAVTADYRNGGSGAGDANWPRASWNGSLDSGIHVIVVRYTVSGSDMLIDLFIDGALHASDLEPITGNINMDRITVGRFDRASPVNSSGGQVFAAASWDRPLTDAEVRALSFDPYSYPTDPADPDDWEEGTVGTEWEDVAFYWDPNHAGDRGINRLYGGAVSDNSVSEGSEVTVSTQDGRQYDGAQASQFNIIPINVSDRFALWPRSDITLMVVFARPGATSDGKALYSGDRDLSAGWATLGWVDADVAHEGDVRRSQSASTPGGANWPIANIAGTDADTDLHTLVLTFEIVSGDGTVTIYRDDFATTAFDTETFTAEAQAVINRFTAGRIDDASPANSVNMQVFAAAVWGRLLTSSEISAVLADPYGFPGTAPPSTPSNPAATAQSSSSIEVTWDDVSNETGYRVERSDDGSSGWTDVSGNLAADATSYSDSGLDAETEYFYRVVAFNGSGDSAPSDVVSATTQAGTGGGNRIGGTGAILRSSPLTRPRPGR